MKTDNLIAFSIPAFLIPNMPQEGDKAFAKVLNHTKTAIELEIGAIGIKIDVKSPAALYKKGVKLYFDETGAVVSGDNNGGDLTEPVTQAKPVVTSAPREGSTRANARLP